MKRLDLTGKQFGRLKVISFADIHKGAIRWHVKCSCGNTKIIRTHSLTSGSSRSCGCLSRELSKQRETIHGLRYSKEYKVWVAMKSRCLRLADISYENYGGRGITVCSEWVDSFKTFYADMGERPEGTSLDRIDNNKGYSKENCRWATIKQQSRNKRSAHLELWQGQLLSVTEIAEIVGVSKYTIFNRLKQGWSLERAVSEPVRPR